MTPQRNHAGVDVKTVTEPLEHDTVRSTHELYGHVTQTISCLSSPAITARA